MKTTNTKSWRKTVLIILTTLFVCSTLSLLTTSFYYHKQAKQAIENGHYYLCENWGYSVDTRLTLVYEQIKDLTISIYNNTEFNKDLNNIDPYTSNKLIDTLQNKIITSDDISSIFLYDTNSGHYIYISNNESSTVKFPNMKSYLKDECQKTYDFLSDTKWEIRQVYSQYYFYKSIKLGRFIIGAVSDCKRYGLDDDNLSCFILNDNDYIYCSGNESILNGISASSLSTYHDNKKLISLYEGNNSKITVILASIKNQTNINIIVNALFIANSLFSVLLIIILFNYMNKRIVKPTKDLIKATSEISNGNIKYLVNVGDAGSEEFKELYVKFNYMVQQIEDLKIESYDMKLNEEENRLRMLRAQVRPHTFLNGITTISNLTYDDDREKIREYIYSFSQFTRYMLHTETEWVSIGEEIKHIENYIKMQKIRFPNSIEFTYDCDKAIEDTQIPFLSIYSLVENSCKHGMDMINVLNIYINCKQISENKLNGILITVEDDGDGFPTDVLEKFGKDELNTKAHLGLSNIRYTLHLLYKRDDLLRISNKENGGAKVEMLIPERK